VDWRIPTAMMTLKGHQENKYKGQENQANQVSGRVKPVVTRKKKGKTV
jgi:hypothetical protein